MHERAHHIDTGHEVVYSHEMDFVDRAHGGATHASAATQNHDMCAAFVHVAADAVVSVLAIIGLLLGRFFGWVFMDSIMGIIGALVIAKGLKGLWVVS